MFYSTITEADAITDGADYLDTRNYDDEDYEDILADRKRREKALVGKYLVLTTSRYQSDVELFLQDSKYGNGYWTKFMSNAKGFYDETAAIVKAKNLMHNNPRVVFVQANGKLKEVYRNGKRTR